MKEAKKLSLHIVLLLVAATAAFFEARPDEDAVAEIKPGEVELWGGTYKDVKSVSFDSKSMTVTLEARTDAAGSWFRGNVTPKDAGEEEPVKDEPDAAHPHGKPSKPQPVKASTFASVSKAEALAKQLAPFRAKRGIGQIEADRESVYGLDDPEGTLVVDVGGKKHTLIVGKAAGAGAQYVRDGESKLVYVIEASIISDLKRGESALRERKLHGWKLNEVRRAEIIGPDKSRTAMRSGPEGRRFWADPGDLDTNNETLNIFLTKVDRLMPNDYTAELPAGAERIVRVEYNGDGKSLGYVELHRVKGDKDDEFFVTSEQMRMFAKVNKTSAAPVERDLFESIFPGSKPADDGDGAGGGEPSGDGGAAPTDEGAGGAKPTPPIAPVPGAPKAPIPTPVPGPPPPGPTGPVAPKGKGTP